MDKKERDNKRKALEDAFLAAIKEPTNEKAKHYRECLESLIDFRIVHPWEDTAV